MMDYFCLLSFLPQDGRKKKKSLNFENNVSFRNRIGLGVGLLTVVLLSNIGMEKVLKQNRKEHIL